MGSEPGYVQAHQKRRTGLLQVCIGWLGTSAAHLRTLIQAARGSTIFIDHSRRTLNPRWAAHLCDALPGPHEAQRRVQRCVRGRHDLRWPPLHWCGCVWLHQQRVRRGGDEAVNVARQVAAAGQSPIELGKILCPSWHASQDMVGQVAAAAQGPVEQVDCMV